MKRTLLSLSLVLALAGCADTSGKPPQPTNLLRYPGAMAASGDGAQVFVVGTNFDREYSTGVLHVFDAAAVNTALEAYTGDQPVPMPSIAGLQLGAVEIPSFGGQLGLYDTPEAQWLYLPVRADSGVAVLKVDPAGVPSCPGANAAGCAEAIVPLNTPAGEPIDDPFSITLQGDQVYVGALSEQLVDPQDTQRGRGVFLARLQAGVDTPAPVSRHVVGSRYRALAPNPSGEGLMGVGIDANFGIVSASFQQVDVSEFELGLSTHKLGLRNRTGALDARALYVDSTRGRAYLLTRRPSAFVVVALGEGGGVDGAQIERYVSLPGGPSEMIPLVTDAGTLFAVTSTDASALSFVDPARGELLAVLDGSTCEDLEAPCPGGSRFDGLRDPRTDVGDSPYSLVALPRPGGGYRLWVSAFGDGTLSVVDLPAPERPWTARVVGRVNAEVIR